MSDFQPSLTTLVDQAAKRGVLLVYGRETFLKQPFGTVELATLFLQEKEAHSR